MASCRRPFSPQPGGAGEVTIKMRFDSGLIAERSTINRYQTTISGVNDSATITTIKIAIKTIGTTIKTAIKTTIILKK